MTRNRLITVAEWCLTLLYPISLAAWAIGHYKPPRRVYRLLYWLEGRRIAKCRECGFKVSWSWKFCPRCGDAVQETLLQEVELEE